MKKIISILLALCLVCGSAVWAVGGLFELKTDRQEDTVTVAVVLNEALTNGTATMLQGELYYDPEVLAPVSAEPAGDYRFVTCVLSERQPRIQFSHVDENSEGLILPAGTVITAEFETLADADAQLRLEMDLQTADGTVVADLTEYATVLYEGGIVCTEHDWEGLTCRSCGARRENPFTDVPECSFFFLPVLWAVDNGITSGATATTFHPAGDLLRAQVVVMLWSAAGKPEPAGIENPFTDVKETDFFYKAVLWAVENEITNGLTTTTFGPYAECNRAQVVTFLWRAMEKPAPSSAEHPFTDVDESQFYFEAMLWAVENGITNGLNDTTFGPNAVCNRAQVVTFLYRTYN